MRNVNLVLLTSDTDCDGTTFGAYRVCVPERFALCRDYEAVEQFCRARVEYTGERECLPTLDYAFQVMPLSEFLSEYGREFFDQRDMEEFCGRPHRHNGDQFPYTSLRSLARWNPWAGPDGDDTIGIPALDTRYDDPVI